MSMTDDELLRLCRERLPDALETTALMTLKLARQYITKGIPEADENGMVTFRPPNARELKDISQSVKWVQLPQVGEKKVEDSTIIDDIERSGMKLPDAVSCDTGNEGAL